MDACYDCGADAVMTVEDAYGDPATGYQRETRSFCAACAAARGLTAEPDGDA